MDFAAWVSSLTWLAIAYGFSLRDMGFSVYHYYLSNEPLYPKPST